MGFNKDELKKYLTEICKGPLIYETFFEDELIESLLEVMNFRQLKDYIRYTNKFDEVHQDREFLGDTIKIPKSEYRK